MVKIRALNAAKCTETAPKRVIQKSPEATGDLIGNKIADKISEVWRIFQNNCRISAE